MAEPAFVEQLPDEVAAWQRQGIVGAAQARRILAHYGLARMGWTRRRTRGAG